MTNLRLALGVCASLLLAACQAQQPQSASAPLELETLHRSAQCGTAAASLLGVPDQASLDSVLNAGMLGATRTVTVDFAQRSVFRLSMGQQPTAGASLAITSLSVDSTHRRMTVNAVWKLPEPGSMQATVVTRPCVVFSVLRGDYRSARVIDSQQQQRLLVDLSAMAR
ncbi:MAG: protease complex subunit PrcB family protein [Chitinophagaceae bacterium]|nr:protease complex subunit PrcB family protein [Rubrivivax sp.]